MRFCVFVWGGALWFIRHIQLHWLFCGWNLKRAWHTSDSKALYENEAGGVGHSPHHSSTRTLNSHLISYCKFGNFRKYIIFANSVKKHISDVKNREQGMIYLYQ